MDTFNVVHIQRPGVRTTLGQWDVARLLAFSLESLGYPTNLQVNKAQLNALNIVVGYERLGDFSFPVGTRYIPYQLEQLIPGAAPLTPDMRRILENAFAVWDYNPANIQILQQQGIPNVKLLPLGFHEKLATIPHHADQDIDILFYGLMNDRRSAILRTLDSRCKLRALKFVYGQERDDHIARAKLVLNIHFFEKSRIAEQVRISYLLNNRRCVVTEISDWDPLAEFCAAVPYNQLIDTCLRLLADNTERDRIATRGYEGFQKRPMPDYLRQIL